MYIPNVLVSQVSQQQDIFKRLSDKHGIAVGIVARHIFMVSRSCLKHRKYGIILEGVHWFHDKLEAIASKCCMSVSTVQRALRTLITEGFITAKKFYQEFQTHEKFYTWNWEKFKGFLNPPIPESGRHIPTIEVTISEPNLEEAATPYIPTDSSVQPSESRIPYDSVKLTISYIQHNILLLTARSRKFFHKPDKQASLQIMVKNTVNSLKDIFQRGNFRRSVEELAQHERKKHLCDISINGPRDSLMGAARPIYDEEKEEERLIKLMEHFNQTVPYNDLLDIWNQHLGEKTGLHSANRQTIPLLDRVFFTHFEGQKHLFQSFCEEIASTPYLMGEDFTLTIWSALSPSFIEKVKSGTFTPKEFGNKKPVPPPSPKIETTLGHVDGTLGDMAARRPSSTVTYSCFSEESEGKTDEDTLRTRVRTLVGELHYTSWFQDARAAMRQGKLKLIPQSEFRRYKWDTEPEFSRLRSERLIDV